MPNDNVTVRSEEELFRERVASVLRDLEDSSLKNEILAQLKKAAKKNSPFEHPALLLVLGFVLTGIVGTWLTSFWQSRAQTQQQAQMAHERALQQKYDLAEQVNKAVSEAYTAAHVILYVISYDQSKNKVGVSEREGYWNQARRNWIINSLALQLKLSNTFENGEAFSLYQEIIDDSDELSVSVNEALLELKRTNWKAVRSQEIVDKQMVILARSADMREKTSKLLSMLVDEIHKEENRPASP